MRGAGRRPQRRRRAHPRVLPRGRRPPPRLRRARRARPRQRRGVRQPGSGVRARAGADTSSHARRASRSPSRRRVAERLQRVGRRSDRAATRYRELFTNAASDGELAAYSDGDGDQRRVDDQQLPSAFPTVRDRRPAEYYAGYQQQAGQLDKAIDGVEARDRRHRERAGVGRAAATRGSTAAWRCSPCC